MTSTNAQPVLSVTNLTVGFGSRVVIQSLSFVLARGENLAIIGPNGSGKSVLLRTLLGLLDHSGSIEWSPEAKLAYVPQAISADRQLPLTINDLLLAKARILQISAERVGKVAATVGLTDELIRTRIGVLSGGQFQKALIAFALLGDPSVLLVDEPTASMDELAQERIYELLHQLRVENKITVLMVSHDLSIVYHRATKVLCISKGKPCFGAPREVLTPQNLAELYSVTPKFYRHLHENQEVRNE